MRRTHQFSNNPLPLLLDAYREYGPIFTMRIFYAPVVFLIGPEANHFVTVSGASNFRWRDGHMGNLIPLVGDGLLTTDGATHDKARRIMLPAFHRERIAASLDTMVEETMAALGELRPGNRVDIYSWTRLLALRIASRALFGFDPDTSGGNVDLTEEFERGLAFYARPYPIQMIRGPFTPWASMSAARRRLDGVIFAEIARRRKTGQRGEDILSLLLDATGEDGTPLSDREVRDQVMTLLFAGHDTTTSTISFLFYELARHPHVVRRLLDEQDRVLAGRAPTAEDLMSDAMPEFDQTLDETLRIYPAAWVGPRRVQESFDFAGTQVPAGAYTAYCSWASHHLPEVFQQPTAFLPERFAPAARAALPKGAYAPFGGGSRMCIGMRFGQLEIKAIATLLLQRFGLELDPGYRMSIRQMPTLSPRDGLPMIVTERGRQPLADALITAR